MTKSWFIFAFLLGVMVSVATAAETFKLNNGETVVGELLLSSANDLGVQIKVDEGKYEKVPWANFSQDDIKKFAGNPKLQQFVEPFIEISPEERIKKTEPPKIEQPPRLELPAKQSIVGAFFSSGLGIFILLLIYAANIYAGYEIAIFRAQPVPMVCGLSAIAPFIVPIVFLSMPTKLKKGAEEEVIEPAQEMAPSVTATEPDDNPMHAEGVQHPTGLKLHEEPQAAKSVHPQTITFQRGQFTFNRRFFETKFPGFFGVVKREADRDMVLMVKAARGEYIGTRISRIAANDLHLQVQKGNVSEEVMIPFGEIQEIKLKHKDA